MAESYRRRCVYCGEWIQMRQMPHGQWVPFNDDNTVHKCDKQFVDYKKENSSGSFYSHSSNNLFSQKRKKNIESDNNGCLTIIIIVIVIAILGLLFP